MLRQSIALVSYWLVGRLVLVRMYVRLIGGLGGWLVEAGSYPTTVAILERLTTKQSVCQVHMAKRKPMLKCYACRVHSSRKRRCCMLCQKRHCLPSCRPQRCFIRSKAWCKKCFKANLASGLPESVVLSIIEFLDGR